MDPLLCNALVQLGLQLLHVEIHGFLVRRLFLLIFRRKFYAYDIAGLITNDSAVTFRYCAFF